MKLRQLCGVCVCVWDGVCWILFAKQPVTVERQPARNIAIMVKEIQHDMVKFKTNEVSRTAIHLTVFPPPTP